MDYNFSLGIIWQQSFFKVLLHSLNTWNFWNKFKKRPPSSGRTVQCRAEACREGGASRTPKTGRFTELFLPFLQKVNCLNRGLWRRMYFSLWEKEKRKKKTPEVTCGVCSCLSHLQWWAPSQAARASLLTCKTRPRMLPRMGSDRPEGSVGARSLQAPHAHHPPPAWPPTLTVVNGNVGTVGITLMCLKLPSLNFCFKF